MAELIGAGRREEALKQLRARFWVLNRDRRFYFCLQEQRARLKVCRCCQSRQGFAAVKKKVRLLELAFSKQKAHIDPIENEKHPVEELPWKEFKTSSLIKFCLSLPAIILNLNFTELNATL